MLGSANYGFWRNWEPYDIPGTNSYGESYGTQKVVFDGPQRLIIVVDGVTDLDIRNDVYEAWKEWVRDPDYQNAEYLPAMRAVGGDPISGTTDQFVGDIYFMTNEWRLVYDPRIVRVTGVLYHDDFETAYYFADDAVLGYPTVADLSPVYPARVSSVVNTYEVAGSTDAAAIAAQVWNTVAANYNTAGTMGALQNEVANISLAAGATPAQIVAEMDANSTALASILSVTTDTNNDVANLTTTVNTINTNVNDIENLANSINSTVNVIDTNVTDIETVVNSIDAELGLVASDVTNIENTTTNIDNTLANVEITVNDTNSTVNSMYANVINIENILTSTGTALTVEQATQLRELYEVFGLDPTKPLVVTLDARTAGANISQSITTTASQTTVTRIP